jgi:acid stress-induced BolA-like protein IbaG/YrbA
MLKPEQLQASIERSLPGSKVQVEDMKGTGDHFQVIVIAEQFAGKPLIEQHQMVYDALKEEIAGELHAVGLKTFSPEAWRRAQDRGR